MGSASLDVLSNFAGFTAALAIAYASLPMFRHLKGLREYVRNVVEESSLVAHVSTTPGLIHSLEWAILYRLGQLRAMNEAPQPEKNDKLFMRAPYVKTYIWLYASNLDKLISIAMGAIASSVIWLATFDAIRFPDQADSAVRGEYLIGTLTYYACCGFLTILSIIIHKYVWKWDMAPDSGRQLVLKILCGFNLVAFCVLTLLITYLDMPLLRIGYTIARSVSYITGWSEAEVVLQATMFMLIFIVTLTLYLLVRGEFLHHEMKSEAINCQKALAAQQAGTVANIKLQA